MGILQHERMHMNMLIEYFKSQYLRSVQFLCKIVELQCHRLNTRGEHSVKPGTVTVRTALFQWTCFPTTVTTTFFCYGHSALFNYFTVILTARRLEIQLQSTFSNKHEITLREWLAVWGFLTSASCFHWGTGTCRVKRVVRSSEFRPHSERDPETEKQ